MDFTSPTSPSPTTEKETHIAPQPNDTTKPEKSTGRKSSKELQAPPAPRRVNTTDLEAGGIRRRGTGISVPVPGTRRGTGLSSQHQNLTFMQKTRLLFVPKHKIGEAPGLRLSIINTVKSSWINLMLLLIPVAWALHFSHQPDTVVFVFCFLSIIPLAGMLGFVTEDLALRVGPTLGGLLNATFGNAVELIISVIALFQNKFRIVQASLLGSILSNLLLVLGMCFFAGGLRYHEQGYGMKAAQLQISLLSISVFSIVIPAAFHSSLDALQSNGGSSQSDSIEEAEILAISRGVAVILIIVYVAYLIFQLWTHSYLYTAEASAHNAKILEHGGDHGISPGGDSVFRMAEIIRRSESSTDDRVMSPHGEEEEEEEEVEEPQLSLYICLFLLAAVTVVTGVTAEFLVSSIDGLTQTSHVNPEFVALILLPLVGNAAEHVTAVTVSVKNKVDLAMTVAVGSSIQIALFVIPLLIIIAWIANKPLSLFFDTFETVVVFLSVLIVNYAIGDGRTNWLEGFILMVIYVIIALSVWYYPGSGLTE